MPCYNYAHLLTECVRSILEQDYKDFEILIMDNCSPDNTPEVAKSFQDLRVRHVRNDSNIGPVGNFNKGLTLARGRYVWVLSADDRLRSPSVLRRYVDVMEANANLGFVFCRAIELRGEIECPIIRWADCGDHDQTWQDSVFFLRLIESCCVVLSSAMMRRACLSRVGLFPTDLRFADDWYLFSMLAMHFEVSYCADPMVFHRVHQDSLTAQYSRDYAAICAGDEFTVLWRLMREAESVQKTSLGNACYIALIRHAGTLLTSGLLGMRPQLRATEFENS